MLVDVLVAVVERDRGHRLLEGHAVAHGDANLIEVDEAEVTADPIEMLLENLRAGQHAGHFGLRGGMKVLHDAVIAQAPAGDS